MARKIKDPIHLPAPPAEVAAEMDRRLDIHNRFSKGEISFEDGVEELFGPLTPDMREALRAAMKGLK